MDEGVRNTGARTLMRGLTLLELVAESSGGAGVNELATRTGLDSGTVSRLLATLRDSGYLRQRSTDRKYSLSSKLTRLSQGYLLQTDLALVSRPILTRLRDELGETIHLAVRDGARTMYADQLEPDRAVRAMSAVGQVLPLHVTAMGRAMLAAMPVDARRRTLGQARAEYLYDSFIRDLSQLDDELELAERRGWATVDRGDDVTRVAAAIRDTTDDPIAALSVSGPSYRVAPQLDQIGRRCVEAARQIESVYNT